jgi:hypothetical protein
MHATDSPSWQNGWREFRTLAVIQSSQQLLSIPSFCPIRYWAGGACRRRLRIELDAWRSYEKLTLTHMVCADFESLITPHHQTDFLGLLVPK